MESFWLIAICALAASIGSLLALRPGERERTTWFFLLVTAGLAGFPVFALGHSLGWWGQVPQGGWAAGPTVVSLPGQRRPSLTSDDCPEGATLVDRVGPHGFVQQCRREGQPHGPHRAWRFDGILSLDCNWNQGRLQGDCARWYLRRGRNLVVKLHQGAWRGGQRSGLHVDRFRTGRLHYEAFFLQGRPRGRVSLRGPAGQTIARFHFDAEGPTGRWLRWHRRTGNVLSDGTFENGRLDGRWTLKDGDTGRRWLEARFKAGALEGRYLEWNPWGIKILDAVYRGGKLHGPYRLHHDFDGKPWVEGAFESGRPVGIWHVRDRQGESIRQCDYSRTDPAPADWCFGRGPWVGRQAPIDLLLEGQSDWVRVAQGQPTERLLDAYDFDYAFPDWSPL